MPGVSGARVLPRKDAGEVAGGDAGGGAGSRAGEGMDRPDVAALSSAACFPGETASPGRSGGSIPPAPSLPSTRRIMSIAVAAVLAPSEAQMGAEIMIFAMI